MSSTDGETPVRTGGGDTGRTSLGDGSRRFKDDTTFDALGALDELQATLGVCRSLIDPASADGRRIELHDELLWLQERLIGWGGVVAGAAEPEVGVVGDIERRFGTWRSRIHVEPRFYLSGQSQLGAELDRSRTIARRAERRLVSLARLSGREGEQTAARFLNVMSDLLFTLARWTDAEAG